MAQAVVGIVEHRGFRFAHDAIVRIRFEVAGADATDVIRFQTRNAVRFDAAKVGLDENVGDDLGAIARDAALLEGGRDEALEFFLARNLVFGDGDFGHGMKPPERTGECPE